MHDVNIYNFFFFLNPIMFLKAIVQEQVLPVAEGYLEMSVSEFHGLGNM